MKDRALPHSRGELALDLGKISVADDIGNFFFKSIKKFCDTFRTFFTYVFGRGKLLVACLRQSEMGTI